MTEKDFKSSFFQWRIPKNLRIPIMKEMENMGLISREKLKVCMNDYYFNLKPKKIELKDDNNYLKYEQLK